MADDVFQTPPHNWHPHENDDQPVTRGEFRVVADAVRRVEVALIGKNPMSPDEDALVGRINSHHRAITEAKWLARGAATATMGIICTWIWGKLTGQSKP